MTLPRVFPQPQHQVDSQVRIDEVSPSRDGVPSPRGDAQHQMNSQIAINDFSFDIDGNGELDPFEKKLKAMFHAADTDGSGTLSPAEMLTIMRQMYEGEKAQKRMGRTIWGLSGLVVLLIVALTGVSIAGTVIGGEAIKESKVPDCSDPEQCDSSNVVNVGTVESYVESIFDLPAAPTNQVR